MVDIVLRPRPQVKLSNQKILHWYQDLDLVTECLLERIPAIAQCGTQFRAHAGALLSRVAGPEVVPDTEADGIDVLVGLDADAPASIRNVLDGGPTIQMATEQAGQAAAEDLDCLQSSSLVLENPRGFTDQGRGRGRCRKTAQASVLDAGPAAHLSNRL